MGDDDDLAFVPEAWFNIPSFIYSLTPEVLTFLVLPFWYLLTRVDPDIFQTSSKTVVCVCVCNSRGSDIVISESVTCVRMWLVLQGVACVYLCACVCV